MKSAVLPLLVLVSSSLLGACATQFTGSAHYPGGPHGCFRSCQAQQMEMSGFVYSGEFASSCVCRPAASPAVAPPSASSGASAPTQAELDVADVAPTVGVELQRRSNANSQSNQNQSSGPN